MKPLAMPGVELGDDICPDCRRPWGESTARCPSCGLTIERIAERIAKAQPLRTALGLIADLERGQGGLLRRGYHYAGPHDFVLRAGTWWTAPEKPHRYRQGWPKACYGNAINMAAVYGLTYVEGYATSEIAPSLPVHHAWNIDGDGRVIDTTWGAYDGAGRQVTPIGVAYCGVEFSVERADFCTWENDATVIDDPGHDWPICRAKWEGETEDTEWPPSRHLEALYAHRDGDLQRSRRLLRELREEAYEADRAEAAE